MYEKSVSETVIFAKVIVIISQKLVDTVLWYLLGYGIRDTYTVLVNFYIILLRQLFT